MIARELAPYSPVKDDSQMSPVVDSGAELICLDIVAPVDVAPELINLDVAPPVDVVPELISLDVASPVDVARPAPAWTEEAELIERARNDIREFSPLYERNVDRIYRYIYRRVGDHDAAEDLTAQTFQQAIAALPGYQWRGVPFSAWLFRIAGNLVIRYRRINGREIAMEHVDRIVDERGAFDDPLDAILQKAQRDLLYTAMKRLSDDQREALVLKYVHGLKNLEVGERMNRTEGGVKQLVHRAMIVLREAVIEFEASKSTSDQR